jgi:hypothetical protein
MGWNPGATGDAPLPIYVASAMPATRNRWTALIRIIMVIPQFIVLFFVGIAALVVTVIGWFAALITGELPSWARDFLMGVARWDLRVTGYLYFLTDQYPPFSLDEEPAYPVQLAFPPASQLNRLAVLFRIFIAIPAAIITWVVTSGLGLLSVGSWFMIVFTGRQPIPLYEATRAALRFETRYYTYLSMVTPEYPWGLFGDDAFGPAGSAPAVLGLPPPPAPAATPASAWSLRLSDGGRSAMIVLIVLGAVQDVYSFVGRF